jgi:hypothetical protein
MLLDGYPLSSSWHHCTIFNYETMGLTMTKSPYTIIRELQEAYFEKHGTYAHACGYLGAVLEGEMARRSKKEQDAFVRRIQEAIDLINQVVKV